MNGFPLSPAALARSSSRRPWVTIAIWIALVVAAVVVVSRFLDDALTTEQELSSQPESEVALDLLQGRMSGPAGIGETIVVRSSTLTVDDPAYLAFLATLRTDLMALGPDIVARAVAYDIAPDPALVSADRHTSLVPVLVSGDVAAAIDNVVHVHEVVDAASGSADFEVLQTGFATTSVDFQELSERDLQNGEALGIPIALVILLLVFGTLAAALLPIVLAGISIVVALGATAIVGQVFDLSFFVVNMITMMGLAVGIDYSLFILSRYREERRNGRDTLQAIEVAGGTASRAVMFSGMTVVVALIGMLIVPVNVFRSLAAGAILVVVSAMLASLTLLPAVLSLMGDRVERLRVPLIGRITADANREREGLIWDRVTRAVMRRPVLGLIVAAGILIAATIPFFNINIGSAGVSTLPEGTRSRAALEVLNAEFSAGLSAPTFVVIDGAVTSSDVQQAVARLNQSLAADPDFTTVSYTPNAAGDLASLQLAIAGDPADARAEEAVRRLRSDYIPAAFAGVDARALVAGRTAGNLDFFEITSTYTPVVFVFVLGISFLLLMVVFRSLVVPAKAIVMNLLSVGAAYGLIVLTSQEGFAADLLGFQQVPAVEAWIPLFLFTVLFGLSMDYHVFMLSRIRERYDLRGDNTEAVAFGLRTTAGMITGAAAIMMAVFGGFAAGDLVMFQQVGFGLAVAVFLDATIVRSVLVPSSMKLLGTRNWYLPGFLRWLPDLRIEASEPVAEPQAESIPAGAEARR